MRKPSINLWFMPDCLMLLVEHSSGIIYRHAVGGTFSREAEIEGILAPVEFSDEGINRIMKLPYNNEIHLLADIADAIDQVLSERPSTKYLQVDRTRLQDSCEAWIWMRAQTMDYALEHAIRQDYLGSIYDFGEVSCVLVWPNSG